MDNIVVSICCITYNHAPYIRECLDGFMMQKCNFGFEVLIHDDASTDGTADIIREYQEKYPNIIKPIFQIQNQWSKGVRTIQSTYNFSRAKGKYIALCEGDDYWTDPLKLQKQVDFLEENTNCKLLVTNAKYYYSEIEKYANFVIPKEQVNQNTRIVSLKYFFSKKGVVFPTGSFMFENIQNIFDGYLKFHELGIPGDRCLQLYALQNGKICCLHDITTVYRVTFTGNNSWTSRNANIYDSSILEIKLSTINKIHLLLDQKFLEYKKYEISGLIVNQISKAYKDGGLLNQLKLLLKYRAKILLSDYIYLIPRMILRVFIN